MSVLKVLTHVIVNMLTVLTLMETTLVTVTLATLERERHAVCNTTHNLMHFVI